MTLLRYIPLFPLAGALLNVFVGRWLGRRAAGLLACAAVGLSFVVSFAIFSLLRATEVLREPLFTWMEVAPLKIEIAFQADALTAVMLLIITGIGLLIHIYSLGYMGHDEGMVRYFAYLNLFIFFMSLLVLADNLLLLFVGWEGVGLCSYLLIGFWYQDHANAIAGNKAFIVNRIGDFGFLLGMLLLFWEMGRQGVWSLSVSELQNITHLLRPERVRLITLLLFIGAAGKSAQIPLYVWLPDAMQGPTPVSALIHAATMVTAGVYMTARLSFLFSMTPETLALIAWIGGLTAFFAATIAVAQNDIKRVLAYSTVSQLGYMFLAVGVGAFSVAIFHLFTHAFFKACLFLSSGSVIHALGGEQDMRKMGGLRRYLPTTYTTYLVATLAISGFPLTAGFFSKDQILWAVHSSPAGSTSLWTLAWLTAGLTAFYMFRQFFLVFHGKCRVDEPALAHIHESPPVMRVPLVLLALGSIFAGWLATPEFMWGSLWEGWLEPVFSAGGVANHAASEDEILFMGVTLAISAFGFLLAFLFRSPENKIAEWLSRSAICRLLAGKYYIDELYDFFFVRPFTASARWLAQICDPGLIDGLVNGVAERVRGGSLLGRQLQSGNVQHYLFAFLAGALALLAYFLGR
ncbi:MAG: NADH-quinone oxidoreductase subunit L [Deltaproteobacteria bacterium RIFCSPLOWO2_12_FULL_60_19]|nr:MAG: NADH-quinone oxidoreductase subunit L [Deltaproteobacteria bacterium RIFCSPLOWO2_12_FULL_60_19]